MAAEAPLKRQREEDALVEETHEETKRHKTYNHILSLLDEEEEENEATQDLSSLLTTLQQELSSDSTFDPLSGAAGAEAEQENPTTLTTSVEDYASSSSSSSVKEEEDNDKERVIRHLLEASDDELGIPNMEETSSGGSGCEYGEEGLVNGGDGFSDGVEVGFSLYDDGLWEFEDVNAHYYSMLQSELLL
ncbi:hypothetical protein Tsubulata_034166 [Turnera subulata]|uniref:Uncharacterized protein n=1 Tax=Turnera subulata TaxID=218843 RepID=A0A9Q0G7V1_9ROSI|nr:hypothetical protein Tsubulata_034166 [Turnera subulata]